jgi:hypothetical protein
MDQQWVVYVFLYYIGALIFRSTRDQILDISDALYDVDSLSPVCVLARLHDPSLTWGLVLRTDFLKLLVLIRLVA